MLTKRGAEEKKQVWSFLLGCKTPQIGGQKGWSFWKRGEAEKTGIAYFPKSLVHEVKETSVERSDKM